MDRNTTELPVRVYTPESELAHPGRLFRDMLAEFLNSRELAMALFKRDMKGQFRQSVLGYAWLFFPPIATTCVWFFLNRSGVVRVADTGIPYPAFVMIGTLLWQAFVDSLMRPIGAMNASRGMLTKLNFPRIAPVLAGVGQTVVTSAVRLVLLIPVFLFVKMEPSWTILLFPFGYLAMVLMGVSIGILFTPIGLLYTDVGKGIQVIAQFAMYATPVVYPMATAGLLFTLNRINPATYVLQTSRDFLTGATPLMLGPAIWVTIGMILLFFISWTMFHITAPRVIERMGM